MLDLLTSAVAFAVVVALGLTGLALLTLVPFVLSLHLAERRAFDPARWGAAALAGSVLGAGALVLLRSSPVLLVPGLLLPAATPLLLLLLRRGSPVGGRVGRHR